MWFQSGATWTIWCDVPLDLMVSRVLYGIKIIISGQPRHTIRNLTLPNPFLSGATQFDRCDVPFDWCDVPFVWCDVPFSVETYNFQLSS